MWMLLLYVVVFLTLSGIVAAVDAAVLSVTRPEVEELIQNQRRGAVQLRQVKDRITRSVVVIVIVTNTINVLGPILVSQQAFDRFGPGALGAITAVLALGTILFSEIIPKAIGAHYAPRIGCLAARPILWLSWLMTPLVAALAWLSQLFTRGTRPIGTEQQIRSLVTIGRRAGHIETDEDALIHRAFVLNDRMAADIMTPLDDVFSLNATATIRQAADRVRRSRFSRFPVIGDSADDVHGIVLGRDILEALMDNRGDEPITSLTGDAIIVESSDRSDDLLLLFRNRHSHLAIVRKDEKTVGLVTLEDVLEELVGEIEDEKDKQSAADSA